MRKNLIKAICILQAIILLISMQFYTTTPAAALTKKGIIKNTGFTLESLSIYNGVFGKDVNNNNVFYGTTIMGNNSMNLFLYDINANKVVKNINIPGTCGSNIISNYNGSIYIGTYSRARLYRYDIKTGQLTKLFEIPGEEVSISDFKIYDGKIFIGTYPNSNAYMYDINTGKLTSFGSMFNLNYVNSIEYDNGKIYAGIGPQAHLIEYDTNTKQKHEINLPGSTGKDTFVYMLKKVKNKLFIGLVPSNKVWSYNLDTKEIKVEINRIGDSFNQKPQFSPNDIYFTGMSGNIFSYNAENDSLTCLQHNSGVKISDVINNSYIACVSSEGKYYETDFAGRIQKSVDLVDVGFHGPPALPMSVYASDGILYFGGKRMSIYNTVNNTVSNKIVAGEPKAITSLDGDIYTANYTDAMLWRFDKNTVTSDGKDLNNPDNHLFNIENQNRPLVMLSNPSKSQLIIASDPYYGYYGSSITIYDSKTGNHETIQNITGKQSVKCMVLDRNNPNYLYIGTTNRGTYGNKALNENAHIIKYDLVNKKVVFDMIPDKKNGIIRSIAYSKGLLYFITENEYNLYSISANSFKTVKILKKSHMKEIISSVDGGIYGLSEKGLWNINNSTLAEKQIKGNFNYLTTLFEDPVTGKIYFFDNSKLYSYE